MEEQKQKKEQKEKKLKFLFPFAFLPQELQSLLVDFCIPPNATPFAALAQAINGCASPNVVREFFNKLPTKLQTGGVLTIEEMLVLTREEAAKVTDKKLCAPFGVGDKNMLYHNVSLDLPLYLKCGGNLLNYIEQLVSNNEMASFQHVLPYIDDPNDIQALLKRMNIMFINERCYYEYVLVALRVFRAHATKENIFRYPIMVNMPDKQAAGMLAYAPNSTQFTVLDLVESVRYNKTKTVTTILEKRLIIITPKLFSLVMQYGTPEIILIHPCIDMMRRHGGLASHYVTPLDYLAVNDKLSIPERNTIAVKILEKYGNYVFTRGDSFEPSLDLKIQALGACLKNSMEPVIPVILSLDPSPVCCPIPDDHKKGKTLGTTTELCWRNTLNVYHTFAEQGWVHQFWEYLQNAAMVTPADTSFLGSYMHDDTLLQYLLNQMANNQRYLSRSHHRKKEHFNENAKDIIMFLLYHFGQNCLKTVEQVYNACKVSLFDYDLFSALYNMFSCPQCKKLSLGECCLPAQTSVEWIPVVGKQLGVSPAGQVVIAPEGYTTCRTCDPTTPLRYTACGMIDSTTAIRAVPPGFLYCSRCTDSRIMPMGEKTFGDLPKGVYWDNEHRVFRLSDGTEAELVITIGGTIAFVPKMDRPSIAL